MAESVELATILLTDLVGPTRSATCVGPVRADRLREEYFALLRGATDACKGKTATANNGAFLSRLADGLESVNAAYNDPVARGTRVSK